MSIVVAVTKDNQTVIASDSQTTFGNLRLPVDNHVARKIRPVGPAWLASTGWGFYEDIFDDFISRKRVSGLANRKAILSFFLNLYRDLHERYGMVNDQANNDDKSPFADLDSSFLVVNRQGIFSISSDMSITPFRKYYAIGSGSDFALGALQVLFDHDLTAEELAYKAVETAISLDVHCGGEIDVQRVTSPRKGARSAKKTRT
ncbi:hypothetical protein HQ520_15830 [bacterium]|nr:hypothetical protein [bacterium]